MGGLGFCRGVLEDGVYRVILGVPGQGSVLFLPLGKALAHALQVPLLGQGVYGHQPVGELMPGGGVLPEALFQGGVVGEQQPLLDLQGPVPGAHPMIFRRNSHRDTMEHRNTSHRVTQWRKES